MKNLIPYSLLNSPVIYETAQKILAHGADVALPKKLREISGAHPASGSLLDIGCGPESWLARIGIAPVGLDLSYEYTAAYQAKGTPGVVASADKVPFANASFTGVWSIGLLHHLTDRQAQDTVNEAVRVCRPGGYVAILDAVLPENGWKRPLARTIRALDRGQWMRKERKLREIFPHPEEWQFTRFTYSTTGLEMLSGTFRKP